MNRSIFLVFALIVQILNIDLFLYQFVSALLLLSSQVRMSLSRFSLAILILASFYLFIKLFGPSEYSVISSFNHFVLFIFLVYLRFVSYEVISNFIVKIACISVPVSIVLSLLYLNGLYDGFHTSEVLFWIERLYFLFNEPAHYGIFLSFALMYSIFLNKRFSSFVILLGLVMTFSFVSFLLFFGLYIIFFIGLKVFNWKNILVVFVIVVLFYLSFLNIDFLNHKINDLLSAVAGEARLTSAFVRLESAYMGFHFLVDTFQNNFSYFILGVPDSESWIKSYYLTLYNLEAKTASTFNIITGLVLESGILGLSIIILLLIKKSLIYKVGYLPVLLSFILFSFTNGYAFGPLAMFFFLLYFLLIDIYAHKK